MGEDSPVFFAGYAAGSRIGGYLLEEQIGQGGMAVVFRALDERLERRVALKILNPALAADEAFRQRFIRESRAAAAVDDPHIIPVFEAGEVGHVLFIAMRYVGGGDVRSLIYREGALAPARAAAIVSSVASALDAAHAAGLVHRDVKPANMLIDSRPGRADHVYLSDFGLTKDMGGTTGLTGTGLFLGTVDYAAPEQVDGRPVDSRTDQYALACTAFEMLCGQPPFRRDQGLAVLLAHRSEPPPPLTSRRAGLPGAVDAVFARALAKSPDDRFASCGEFSDALQAALRIGPYDAGPPRTEFAVSPPPVGSPGPGSATFPHWFTTTPEQRPGARPAHRWPVAIIAAASTAIVVAIGAVLLVVALRPGNSGNGSAAGAGTSANSSPAGHSSAASPATAAGSGSPSGTTAGGLTWVAYHDPSGFSIDLPVGWSVSSSTGTQVKFAGSPSGFAVVVAWSYTPKPDALADWQQQAASKAASDPTYQQIRVTRVSYRSYNAADWEFINDYQGVPTHVLDRNVIVSPGHLAYALELYGPAGQWPAVYASMWNELMTSFEPAS